jgi:hypothetical protein
MEFVAEKRIILPKSYTDGLSGGLKVYIIIENICNKMHKHTINIKVN